MNSNRVVRSAFALAVTITVISLNTAPISYAQDLSTITIKWDNGNTITHYLYEGDDLGFIILSNQSGPPYRSGHAFFNANTNDTGYWGCGIAFAQSALRYFGIDLTREEIRKKYFPSHTVNIPLIAHGIYVRPTTLHDGLVKALSDYAGGGYMQTEGRGVNVRLETGKSAADIARHLSLGYPVIALVNGGEHYVLVVGQESKGRFIVVDSDTGGPNKLNYPVVLDLSFSSTSSLAQHFQSDSKWQSGMIIFFDPIPLSPAAKCAIGQKDCDPPHGHCTTAKYCCSGYGCERKCATGKEGKAFCP